MDKNDIAKMARQAGMLVPGHRTDIEELERFAYLVAAAEREACAKVCESLFDMDDDSCNEAEQCAGAIRARGNQ